jgi:hypothetical protein
MLPKPPVTVEITRLGGLFSQQLEFFRDDGGEVVGGVPPSEVSSVWR